MAQVDYYLKVDGIDGESTNKDHKDKFEIESWSFGVQNASAAERGSGLGRGKATVQDLHFTSYMNKGSVPLAKACASGQHIKEAILVCNKASGDNKAAGHEYLKITLSDVFVSSYVVGGSNGGGNVVPMDQFSLSYNKIKMEYTEQTAKGGKGAAPKMEYNVKEGALS